MSSKPFIIPSLLLAIALPLAPLGVQAEIVERELGTNAQGEVVTGYVFQAPRGFARSSGSHRRATSSRVVRPETKWRGQGRYRPARGLYTPYYGSPAWGWRHTYWNCGAGLYDCAPASPAPFCGTVIIWHGGF